jgi:hypothetical protein
LGIQRKKSGNREAAQAGPEHFAHRHSLFGLTFAETQREQEKVLMIEKQTGSLFYIAPLYRVSVLLLILGVEVTRQKTNEVHRRSQASD